MRQIPADTVVDGRYRIISRLGSGGMADVYCAEDSQLGRRVALKVLYERFAEDEEFVERFRREASHAAGLNHQHVVSIYDRGEWEGTSYIAMEFVDGRTLKQLIQAEAPMDPVRAIDLIVQVLRAARFAHRRGVIHRDLKPHNVIVEEQDPEHPRAKVADFGIARAGASDMTQTGSIMGTAQYLSPEQAQGQAVTPQSDIYSIGICLYEMLAGRVPFEGDSAVAIALKQVNETPVPPSHYNAAVPAPLEDAVLRALAKDPGERFADADAFIAALEDAKAQIEAGLAPPAQPTAAFAAVAAAPLAAETIYAPPLTGVEEVAYVPPDDEDDGPKWPWLLLISAIVVGAIVAALLLTGAIGGKKVTVPKVVGIDQASAATVLHRSGLNVHFDFVTSGKPKGITISQNPDPGTKVKEDSTVHVSVSTGPGDRQIPNVDGLARNAARKALTEAGFKIKEHQEISTADPPVAKGHVTRTIPSGGTPNVPIGSVVDLYISTGPPNVDVPDVTNQKVADARSTLTNAGFKVTTVDKQTADQDPGTVLSQSPASGQAPKGSTVTLTVAKAPDQIAVPDETGKLADHASIDLQKAGFIVGSSSQDTTDPSQDGRVISQDPKGGAKAAPKSTVTIVVGHYVAPTPTTPTTTETTPAP